MRQVAESYDFWKDLVAGTADPNEVKFAQTSNNGLDSYVSCEEATEEFDLPKKSRSGRSADVPKKFQGWFSYSAEGELFSPDMQG